MVMAAGKKWNIDIPGSVLIGDSDRDRKLAHRCGMSFVLVEEGKIVGTQPSVMI
jgi:histidinol phosphatase-like enzyme